jgi:EAL domain-containing protein (putative c-di-GMP-specific phosphodiesterase class I)
LEYYTTEFFEELKMIPSLYEYYHYLEWRVAAVHSYKDGRAFDELFHKANMCLRYAKETQKFNEIIFFSNDIQFDFEKSDVLLKEIELAINKNEFELFVQEKTDTTHNQVVGLEALARWESSLLGPISPGVFIPIIEDNDKSIQFGEMVIRKGLSLIPLIDDKYGEIPLSINISPSHLKSLNFLNYLLEQIEETKVDPKRIEIEITENVLLDDFEYTYDLIKSIQSHGFKVSLDDFGTGFSSLQYLIDLPVNTIKIDRAFIRNIHTDKKQKILVESILRISEANGYSVVAEGVEEKEQVDILNELGCNIVQGYYYSKPEQLNK